MSDLITQRDTHANLNDRDALHELLVASLTIAFRIGDLETGDRILEAIRALHRDEDDPRNPNEPGRAGFV